MANREAAGSTAPAPMRAFRGDAIILREAIEEFPGPVAIFDQADRLIAHNQDYQVLHNTAFQQLHTEGRDVITYSDLVSISRNELVPVDERDDYLKARVAMHRRADGKPFDQFYPGHGWIRYKKVRTASGAVAVFGTDITELQTKTIELEDAMLAVRMASEAKSAFLANMSHELRTPLNAILGFSEALQIPSIGQLKEGTQTEYVGHIQSAGKHLLGVIGQLLDIAKIEAGELKIERRACCLFEIVEESIVMTRVAADEKNIVFKLEDNVVNTVVYGDEQWLSQVFLNVISNAVKFSEDGGTISVGFDGLEDRISVRVSDEGIGIPADMISTVFRPFGQVETAYSRSQDGTGLGLPLARAFVEAHSGTLTLTSEVDIGTTVLIELPRH